MRPIMPKFLLFSLVGALIVSLSACKPVQSPAVTIPSAATASSASEPTTLIVASHDSFAASDEVISAFEKAHNAKIQVLELGDAGEALNKIILSKDAPLADLFYGVDNTFLSRALDGDIFIPYDSPLLTQIPDELKMNRKNRFLPVDTGYLNINPDRVWFNKHGTPVPPPLKHPANPQKKGFLVVLTPATSS